MPTPKNPDEREPETPKIREHRVPIRDPDERFGMDDDERKSADDTSHVGASAPDTDPDKSTTRGEDADAEELNDDDIIESYDLYLDPDLKNGEGPDA